MCLRCFGQLGHSPGDDDEDGEDGEDAEDGEVGDDDKHGTFLADSLRKRCLSFALMTHSPP